MTGLLTIAFVLICLFILKIHISIRLEILANNRIINELKIKVLNIQIYAKETNEELDIYILNTILIEEKDVEEGIDIGQVYKTIYRNFRKLKTNINVKIHSQSYILNAYLNSIIAIILSMYSRKQNKYYISTKYSAPYFGLDIHIICNVFKILKIYIQLIKEGKYGKTSN